MRILIVNKFLYPNGGSEIYIFKLGSYLITQGHEVQYFGMEHEGRCVGNNVNAYTSDMDFHGGSKLIKLAYPIKTIYSTESRRKIRKVLDDFQPDVVHLNNFNYQLTPSIISEIVAWRKTKNHSCRIIYTAHDYQLVCPNHMMRNPNTHQNCEKCLRGHFINCLIGRCIHGSITKSTVGMLEALFWKFKEIYKYLDAVVCPSVFVQKKMESNPMFKEKTVAIHNFIDIPEFERKKTDKRYVFYFGRLSEEKGVNTLIEVCKSLPEVNFIVAGTGPLSDEVSHLPNVDFKGFQQGDALLNLISNALVCVCPSEWYEVFGLSIGESIVLGTPVIACNVGGIPEFVIDGVNGKLVRPGNFRDMEDVIINLWNDQELVEKLQNGCKETHLSSVAEYYKKIIKVYTGY